MRILVLTKTLPFPPRNGLELPVAKIFNEIGRLHEVDILVISEDRRDFERRRASVPSHLGRAFFLAPGRLGKIKRVWNELSGRKPAFFSHTFNREQIEGLETDLVYDFVWVSPPGNYTFVEACRKYGIGSFSHLILGLNDLVTSIYSKHISEILHRRIFDWRFLSFGIRSYFIGRLERKYLYWFDLVHLQTRKEEEKAIRLLQDPAFKERVIASPNGIKNELLRARYQGQERGAILYMTHLSGDRSGEAQWFVRKVWPEVRAMTDAELWLVGTPPTGDIPGITDDNRIRVLGYVDDLPGTYEQVRLCIVPIFHNCGLINRIQDALAAGTPLVATEIAAATFPGLESGQHVLTAGSPAEFARQTIRLYSDLGLRLRLSQQGRQYATALPTWKETALRIRKRMESKVERLKIEQEIKIS